MNAAKIESPLLFEVAWEVCNQVGGIYTVIKTKTPATLSRWGNNYFLIGPYNQESAAIEFEQGEIYPPINRAAQALAEQGIKCHVGRWLIRGKPQVILLEFNSRYQSLHEDKYFLWKDHGVSLPGDDCEVNQAIAFGYAVFEFFKALRERIPKRRILGHFHEWQSAVAIPRLRHAGISVATIFTTHATLLGRYMAGGNPNFYDHLDSIEPYSAARSYNIEPRFLLERLATQSAHVFTTISSVTARETARFLGRTPDFILPNGITLERFTALHEFQNLHLKYKEEIHQFVMGHFFSSYSFDLDRTMYIFTSGRYEYRNKGMDLFIEALHRLNHKLKEIFDPPTVVAFIITKGAVKSVSVGSLQRQSMLDDLRSILSELEEGLTKKILPIVAAGHLPQYEDLLPNEFQVRLKRAMHARRTNRLPAIVTHDMQDDADDPILNHLRHRHLFNEPTDPVKVVFHPQFLSATSTVLNLDYDQFVRGCHIGVFPSYYEPWGYTPLECLALGIPTVTTDLTGFGDYAATHLPQAINGDLTDHGLCVLHRAGKSSEDFINELTSYLFKFIQFSRRERIELRNRAERLSESFDWTHLVAFYHQAHEEALNRTYQ